MVDVAATGLVEFGVVRDDKKVAALRQARHEQEVQMAQAQAQAQQAKQMASAAKDLSQTPVGQGGTALDAILTGGRA